jgi:hypothetical protein
LEELSESTTPKKRWTGAALALFALSHSREKIDDAIAFFEAHISYQSSEVTLKKFRQLRATGRQVTAVRISSLLWLSLLGSMIVFL